MRLLQFPVLPPLPKPPQMPSIGCLSPGCRVAVTDPDISQLYQRLADHIAAEHDELIPRGAA